MYKSINQLIGEITSLAANISLNTKIDVFTEYIAHCDMFEIRIYENGWVNNYAADIEETFYIRPNRHHTEKEILNKLQQIERQLIKIARKGKINFSKLPYEIIPVKSYRLIKDKKSYE